jgi:hypothetical protein
MKNILPGIVPANHRILQYEDRHGLLQKDKSAIAVSRLPARGAAEGTAVPPKAAAAAAAAGLLVPDC